MNYENIKSQLYSSDSNVFANQFRWIENLDKVPVNVQQLVIKRSQDGTGETESFAVICLKKCIDFFDEVRDILLEKLTSSKWGIRANAAKSLAFLGADDEYVIDQLMSLMGDCEGHDFSPEESAIEALGIIGIPAKKSASMLIKMANDELDSDKWEEKLILLFESLMSIDQGSDELINVLIRAVDLCKSAGITNAIRHLTTFNHKSKAVLPYLEPYVLQQEWLDEDYMTEESDELILLKALFFIGGSNHPLLTSYIENLKAHSYKEGQIDAIEFEKHYLNG